MAKWVARQVLDGALAVISGADRMLAVSGQPADYAQAWAGRLAVAEMGGADFDREDGVGSGRRVSIAGKSGLQVLSPGTADHVALVNSAQEQLLYVTTCPLQELVAGGTVSFDGWSVEIGAPL